jgi:hypothetical protein
MRNKPISLTRRGALAALLVIPAALTTRFASAAPPIRLTPAEIARIGRAANELPRTLVQGERALLDNVVSALRAGRTEDAKRAWAELWKALDARHPVPMPNAPSVVDWTLREAYLVPRPKLLAAADQVGFHAERERAQLEVVRSMRAAAFGGPATDIVVLPSYTLASTYVPMGSAVLGKSVMRVPRSTVPDLATKAKALLETISKDLETATGELEVALRSESQAAQSMTTMSKTMHDIATSIVQNARA